MSTWKLVAVVLCGVAGLVVQTGGQTAAAEVRFQKQDDRVDVTLDGKPFTSYIFSGYAKPILYPVIGPDGVPMTRSFPVEKGVEGEANDHPHHESLWFTHDEVNGVDFWRTSLTTRAVRRGSCRSRCLSAKTV